MGTRDQRVLEEYYRLRQRARTDLLFLANEVLGYKDINREEHGPILDVLQAFPGGEEVFDGRGEWAGYRPFADLWELKGRRNNLIIYPRGTYKTSLCSISHTVQWIINYPDVRGLLSTATGPQVIKSMTALLGHFRFNGTFRALFPEFCPAGASAKDWGSNEGFTVPCRQNRALREQTLSTCTIGKVMSGDHVEFIKHADVVDDENVKTPFQVQTTKDHFGMCNFLLHRGGEPKIPGWQDTEGTFKDFCLAGKSRILMADWSHKPISSIQVGDKVVGWKLDPHRKRILVPCTVRACGNFLGKVNRYTFQSGAEIICTPEHRWWKGKSWHKNDISKEYLPLWTGTGPARLKAIRRLLVPTEKKESWASGWLAGLYDGEGSFQKNLKTPSGTITICQTLHNPIVIEKTREALHELGFSFNESWHDPNVHGKGGKWKKRCVFKIAGGWTERYRFLAEIAPYRTVKVAASLFAALSTDEDKLVSVEDAGLQQVYWFQTETGNYFAEGCASKNSDYYCEAVDKHASDPDWNIVVRPPYREDGSLAFPRTLSREAMKLIEKQPGMTPFIFSCEILLKPVPQGTGLCDRAKLEKLFMPPALIQQILPRLRLHATVDVAGMEANSSGDYTCLTVAGFDNDGRVYVVDMWHGRFTPDEVIDLIFLIYSRYPRILDIKIEKDAHARVLAAFLRREMAKRQKFPPVVTIPRDNRQSKKTRIRGLQPWFVNASIRFAEDLAPKMEIIHEVTRFSDVSTYHDDILDTLADQMQNHDGGVMSDVIPDEPREGVGPGITKYSPKFLGYGPGGKPQWSNDPGGEEFAYDEHTGL